MEIIFFDVILKTIFKNNGRRNIEVPHCPVSDLSSCLFFCLLQIHMKTMPAAMYRLLTAQEQPVYI